MRTTVDLNDELFRKAKQQAAKEGLTLREVIERALRAHLKRRPGSRKRHQFRLKPFRGQGPQPGGDLGDWNPLRDRMDGLG
jgi:hypothetical protein